MWGRGMSRECKFSPRSLLLASTLLMPFYLDRAQAACAPDPPADNATASCTGPTTDQSGTNGYGTISLSNNTITVQPGASVIGTDNGIVLSTGSVANFGSISTASNNGVFVVGTGVVTNSGLIDGGNNGASITNGSLTNTNTGIISGGNVGVFFRTRVSPLAARPT